MKKMKRKTVGNAGSSMVEVLVAFLVVMIMMAMFSKVVAVSVDFYRRSHSAIERTEQFNEKYYKTAERANRADVAGTLSLELDTEKTSVENRPSGEVKIALPKGRLQKYKDTAETKMSRYSILVVTESEEAE